MLGRLLPKKKAILLIEEILHHLGCVDNGLNGINYLSTGAGFLKHQQYLKRKIKGKPLFHGLLASHDKGIG